MTCVFFGANWRESGQKTAVWLAVVIRWLPMRTNYVGATFGAITVYWPYSRSLNGSPCLSLRFTANEENDGAQSFQDWLQNTQRRYF